jgi:hypothetical protein
MARKPTTAHPDCACRPHEHGDGHCIGTEFEYERSDGTRYMGACRILGPLVLPHIRAQCPVHGKTR